MTTQTDQTITQALQQLTKEVNNLKTEITRIQDVILKERLAAVETALAQNRLTQYADLLNQEADEDLNHILNPTCQNKTKCHQYFKTHLTENINVAKTQGAQQALTQLDTTINKIGDHIEKAKGTPCENCQTNFQKKLKREKRALQTIVLVEKTDQQTQTIDVSSVVENFLEPLASPARLNILLSLSQGKKNFSKMAQILDLKGGHLIFHLKKLLDAQLIAQEDNKGDYLITPKGTDALRKIVALQKLY